MAGNIASVIGNEIFSNGAFAAAFRYLVGNRFSPDGNGRSPWRQPRTKVGANAIAAIGAIQTGGSVWVGVKRHFRSIGDAQR
jgi:hypothetical protein